MWWKDVKEKKKNEWSKRKKNQSQVVSGKCKSLILMTKDYNVRTTLESVLTENETKKLIESSITVIFFNILKIRKYKHPRKICFLCT